MIKHKAKLTIRGLHKMTKGERGIVLRWLKRQTAFIKPMHREFGPIYTSRIMK